MGIKAELIAGAGGIFQVHADGDLIYDKAETDRFPSEGEVTALLEKR